MDSFDPASVSVPTGHVISGKLVNDARAGIDIRRPSDGQIYAALPDGDAEAVDHAVTAARHAFETSGWPTMAPRARARILQKWADLVVADAPTLGPLESVGSTRPIRDAMAGDVPNCADVIRFFAELCDKDGGDVAATAADHLGLIIREPLGVIGAITPWNFPLAMAAWKIAPALAAGNAVVLKPSELTPFSVNRLALLAVEAGIPSGILNIVQGRGQSVGEAICRHPGIAKVSFTGSTQTGAKIMAICAMHGTKPVTLELGGKSPQIVFADVANLPATTALVARAISGNAGQVCIAGSRLIVEERIADEMMAGIAKAFGALKAGATWDAGTTLPPIISQAQCDRISGYVDRARDAGARIVCGGERLRQPQDGAYYAPTIVTNVMPDAEIVRDEVFGPVLTVQSFRSEEEAFALSDHPVYALASGLHTSDVNRAMRGMRRIRAGTVWINRYGRSGDHSIPTGGFGHSGIGKDLGRHAFEASSRLKSVLMGIGS
jgi:aldehyde dehydrogenase (NAD+)